MFKIILLCEWSIVNFTSGVVLNISRTGKLSATAHGWNSVPTIGDSCKAKGYGKAKINMVYHVRYEQEVQYPRG
jgi:hypothetical protein